MFVLLSSHNRWAAVHTRVAHKPQSHTSSRNGYCRRHRLCAYAQNIPVRHTYNMMYQYLSEWLKRSSEHLNDDVRSFKLCVTNVLRTLRSVLVWCVVLNGCRCGGYYVCVRLLTVAVWKGGRATIEQSNNPSDQGDRIILEKQNDQNQLGWYDVWTNEFVATMKENDGHTGVTVHSCHGVRFSLSPLPLTFDNATHTHAHANAHAPLRR